MTTVLLVEDELALRRALSINLTARRYHVTAVATGVEALRALEATPPDLVILDLGLPDMDGTRVLEVIRSTGDVPVIVLSARAGEKSTVEALDQGADDYVTKPFGMDELLARMRVALRHAPPPTANPVVRTDCFELDFVAKKARRAGEEVRLTPTEWHLAEVLTRQPGVLVTGSALLAEVWGPRYGRETNYLRVYMAQLRRKLENDASRPQHFITEHSLGYRFEP